MNPNGSLGFKSKGWPKSAVNESTNNKIVAQKDRRELDARLEKDLYEAQQEIARGKTNTAAYKKAEKIIENVGKVYAVQVSYSQFSDKIVGCSNRKRKGEKRDTWGEDEIKFVKDKMAGGDFMNVGGYGVMDWVGIAKEGNATGVLNFRTPRAIFMKTLSF